MISSDGNLRTSEIPYVCHLGNKQSEHLLTGYFFWPNMNKDIENHVTRCQSVTGAITVTLSQGPFTPLIPPDVSGLNAF